MRDYKEYQEALDNVKQCENYYVNQDHIINKGTPNSNKLQELVELRKPMKVKRVKEDFPGEYCPIPIMVAHCPVCNEKLFHSHKNCPNCTKALDWSE